MKVYIMFQKFIIPNESHILLHFQKFSNLLFNIVNFKIDVKYKETIHTKVIKY